VTVGGIQVDSSSQRVANTLGGEVQSELDRLGLLCRVFSRAKSRASATGKKECKAYGGLKKLQDALGIRIALYFSDDVEVAIDAVKRIFAGRYLDTTRDVLDLDSFCPQRTNLVFRLDETEAAQVDLIRNHPDWVDSTFELQLRTVLSEGWHEVDHDLRYKCREDWEGHGDLERSLNGFMATLETCDWAMLQLFDELALRHYRARKWCAMLRCKLRVRMAHGDLRSAISKILDARREVARQLFRVHRGTLLRKVAKTALALPSCYDNWVFVMNHVGAKNPDIAALAPEPVQEQLARFL
jgi:ppGpp synthetase/RelA/SpoT-type nucleotidyltranferase